jgi:hypothetical protein
VYMTVRSDDDRREPKDRSGNDDSIEDPFQAVRILRPLTQTLHCDSFVSDILQSRYFDRPAQGLRSHREGFAR